MAQGVMTPTWDWREALRWIRWRKRFIAMIAIAFMTGAALYAATLPTLYMGRTVVALVPRATSGVDSDDAVEVTMPVYAARIQGPEVIAAVARDLEASPDELADELVVSYEQESSTMTIETQMSSPADAAGATNGLAELVVLEAREDPFVEAEIVSRAFPEGEPDAPRRGLLALSALGAGALVGAAASMFAESTNRKLRDTRDITRIGGLPVLGGIPKSRVFVRTPRRALAHPTVGSAFRSMRTAVLSRMKENDASVVAVTSSQAGAGKTTIAALLAESIARVGKTVLLIDADLYRPTLARKFKLDVHRSLAAALRGTVGVQEAMKHGWVDGLWVLTTKADEEAGDLVATRLPGVLRRALELVDVVVIDTPPLSGSAEGKAVASMADSVLVVVRIGTTQDPLFDALGALDNLRVPILGVVANALPGDLEADYAFE